MIRRSTWIVLGIFVVVLVAAFLWTRFKPEQAEAPPQVTVEPLWSLSENEIAGLRLEDMLSGDVVELRRDADGIWRLEEPEIAVADAARVERAVSWLTSPTPHSSIASVGSLEPFGLDEPLQKVTVFLVDGTSMPLDIGRQAPTGSFVYLRRPDRQEVLTVSSYGLQEVLDLLDDVPLAQPTEQAEGPGSESTDEPTEETSPGVTTPPAEGTSTPQ